MDEREFHQRIEALFEQITCFIDEHDLDVLDYDENDGVLILETSAGAKIILSKQTPISQLWVAAPTGGFHFDYDVDGECWRNDRDKTTLAVCLAEITSRLLATPIQFPI